MSNKTKNGLESLKTIEFSENRAVVTVTRLKDNKKGWKVYVLDNGKIAFLDRKVNSSFNKDVNIGDVAEVLIVKDMSNYVFISNKIGEFCIEEFLDKLVYETNVVVLEDLITKNVKLVPNHLDLLDRELTSLQALSKIYKYNDDDFNIKINYLDMIAEELEEITSTFETSDNTKVSDNTKAIEDLECILEILESNGLDTRDVKKKMLDLTISTNVIDSLKDIERGDNFVCTIKNFDGLFIASKDMYGNEFTPVSFPSGITEAEINVIVIDELLLVSKIQG